MRPPGSRRSVTVTCTVEPSLTEICGPFMPDAAPAIENERYADFERLQSWAESVHGAIGPLEKASTSKVACDPTGMMKKSCRGAALKYTSPLGTGLHGSPPPQPARSTRCAAPCRGRPS